jgi:Right handed beta helix region
MHRGRFTIIAVALVVLAFPAIAEAGYCDALREWTGSGPTTMVRPGQSIQAAVNDTAAGGTVELLDGNYGKQSVSITKRIRLKARNQYGAVLSGIAPTVAGNSSSGTGVAIAGSRAAGAMVDGLDIRYYAIGIAVDSSGPLTIQRNRITSMSSTGIQVWDARQPVVQCNDVRDPYLAGDSPSQSPSSRPAISDAQSDYGVTFYGSTDPVARNNYFMGVFNQTLSFKEGNRNPTASFNTFEGSQLTALFFGQNRPHNGPYDYTGLPVGPDVGTLTADSNVFRKTRDSRGVYYLGSPIRVWHVDGATTLKNNVVETSAEGLGIIECRISGDAGCAKGTVTLENNTVSGAVLNGSTRVQVGNGCLLTVDSWNSRNAIPVSLRNQTCVSTNSVIVGSGLAVAQTGTRVVTGPIPRLRSFRPAFDPDLSYAGDVTSTATSMPTATPAGNSWATVTDAADADTFARADQASDNAGNAAEFQFDGP